MVHDDERPMFLLGPIAATLRWLEELANLLSGPLLVAGLAIALIDLLTDGALLTAVPALLYAWAIAQAVGVDAQLVGAFDRAKRAALQRRWWSLLGLLALGVMLAYVAYVAGLVFATQQAHHVSEAVALASLGLDPTTWLWQRVGVSVFLVCLSGFTRYRTPRQTTLDDERAKLERELTLEPLRQRVRGVKLAGVRSAASALTGMPLDALAGVSPTASTAAPATAQAFDGTSLPANAYTAPDGSYAYVQAPTAAGAVQVGTMGGRTGDDLAGDGADVTPDASPETPPTPPTGPGSPTTAPTTRARRQRKPSQPAASLRLVPDREGLRQQRTQRQAAQGSTRSTQGPAPVRTPAANESLETVARLAFANGATSKRKMIDATGMGASAAASWVRTLKAEAAATTTAQRVMPLPSVPDGYAL